MIFSCDEFLHIIVLRVNHVLLYNVVDCVMIFVLYVSDAVFHREVRAALCRVYNKSASILLGSQRWRCPLTDWLNVLLWHLTNRRWNYNARIDKWYSLYDKKHYSLQFAYMSSQYEFLYSSLVIKSQSLRCPWCSCSPRLRCGLGGRCGSKGGCCRRDRQTDGRTPHRCIDPAPREAGNVNKLQLIQIRSLYILAWVLSTFSGRRRATLLRWLSSH